MKSIKAFLLALIASTAIANDTETFDRKYISNSNAILQVRIIKAEEVSFNLDGQSEMCGVNYVASIQRVLKGSFDDSKFEFSSVFPHLVGEEYLLIRGNKRPEQTLFVEWPKEYEQAYSKCEKNLHENQVAEMESFHISDDFPTLDGTWVVVDDENLRLNKQFMKRSSCFYGDTQCVFIRFDSLLKLIGESTNSQK